MTAPRELRVSIPSDTAAGQQLQEDIISVLEELEYPSRDVFGVRLALEEALVNAIKHGNRFAPDKQVQVRYRITSGSILIEIEDEGSGFSLDDVPDPTMEENLERPCGRGIMLMRHFLDSVSYNETGNKVVLEKDRSEDCPAPAEN